ncbi:MAG: TetR/AcrR family transcriptional regulator [Oscillospiraceae bacterium]|nr:TetR/AcrR family transcriptional regulator [Oscillospiraceae bacterium]
MNGFEKRTAAKKAAIIGVARDLFAQRGMRDVSVSEIARGAGVSQVSIYNYFEDKNALAKEAFVAYIEAELANYERILGQDMPFADKLELIMQGKSSVLGQMAQSHFNEKALDDKMLRQVFQEAIKEKAEAIYSSFIELGKRDGAIDAGIPTEAIMSFFMMSMSIFQQSEYMKESNEYKMGILKLFMYGVIGKPPGPQEPM